MRIKHLLKEARYYNGLDGSLKRIGSKFIFAKTPLRNIVNKKTYNSFYEKRVKKKSKCVNPKFIQIENTNFCNATCIMCPHTSMKRKKKIMSQKDFEKIINNIIKNYPSIKTIIITGFGEPFIDKGILEKIEFLNKAYPKLNIDIYTNASLLKKELTDKVLKQNIHKINFSLNGTKRTYKKMMGLNYEDTIKNVLYFLNKKREMKKKFPLVNISMMIMKENEKEITEFENFWIDKADSVMIYPPSDWAGKKKINYATSNPFKKKKWPCRVLWNFITIDVDGNLIMCCRDYESKIKFGNLLKEDVKNIFEGKRMNNIREMQLKNNFSMPLCKDCDNSFDSSLDWWD